MRGICSIHETKKDDTTALILSLAPVGNFDYVPSTIYAHDLMLERTAAAFGDIFSNSWSWHCHEAQTASTDNVFGGFFQWGRGRKRGVSD